MYTIGNDLARALKWGAGYTGEKVVQVLLSVEDANVVEMDRYVKY
jgi:diacylglycerol kinase (ATP)